MIDLQPHGDGTVIPVQAQPKARRNAVTGIQAGRLKVAVTQPPEKGQANEAVLDVLAEALGLRRSQVRLVAGETSRQKKVLVTGVASDELHRRIGAVLTH